MYILASAHGGIGRWGPAIFNYFQMPDEDFASSGHRPVAKRLYEMAGVGPHDVDVALLYDHFSPMVIMQLEDYGFCPIGEGGPFVADGNIRWPTGTIPVNTHGGNLSEAYIIGMTHVREAVEQLRGTAVNQVEGAEIALVTGGPPALPGERHAAAEVDDGASMASQGVFPSILTDPLRRRRRRSRSGTRRWRTGWSCRAARTAARSGCRRRRSASCASHQRRRVGRAAGHRDRLQLHRRAPPARTPISPTSCPTCPASSSSTARRARARA